MPLNLALLFCVIATMFFVLKKTIILCLILCVVYFQCCWTACFNGEFLFSFEFSKWLCVIISCWTACFNGEFFSFEFSKWLCVIISCGRRNWRCYDRFSRPFFVYFFWFIYNFCGKMYLFWLDLITVLKFAKMLISHLFLFSDCCYVSTRICWFCSQLPLYVWLHEFRVSF